MAGNDRHLSHLLRRWGSSYRRGFWGADAAVRATGLGDVKAFRMKHGCTVDPTMPGTVDESTGPAITASSALPSRAPWPPFCDSCSLRLTEPGAVVLTPPGAMGLCRKMHLCVGCFHGMFRGLDP